MVPHVHSTKLKHAIPKGKKVVISDKNHTAFKVIDIFDENKRLIKRQIYQVQETIEKYLKEEGKYNILYRGTYLLSRAEVKKLSVGQMVELNSRKKLLDYIFIDIDRKYEKDGKIVSLIRYLKKIGLDAYRYDTSRGYHIYILFKDPAHLIKLQKRIGIRNSEAILFAKDKRVNFIIEGLKHILDKLEIEYDIVSAEQGVWYEEYKHVSKPSATICRFVGKRISANLAFAILYSKAKHRMNMASPQRTKGHTLFTNNKSGFKQTVSGNTSLNIRFSNSNHSSDVDVLRENYQPAFALISKGCPEDEAYHIFCSNLNRNLHKNTFSKFYSWCKNQYNPRDYKETSCWNRKKDLSNKKSGTNESGKKGRYTQYLSTLYDYIKSDAESYKKPYRKISSETRIPLASLYEMMQILCFSLSKKVGLGKEDYRKTVFELVHKRGVGFKKMYSILIHGRINTQRGAILPLKKVKTIVRQHENQGAEENEDPQSSFTSPAFGFSKSIYGRGNSYMIKINTCYPDINLKNLKTLLSLNNNLYMTNILCLKSKDKKPMEHKIAESFDDKKKQILIQKVISNYDNTTYIRQNYSKVHNHKTRKDYIVPRNNTWYKYHMLDIKNALHTLIEMYGDEFKRLVEIARTDNNTRSDKVKIIQRLIFQYLYKPYYFRKNIKHMRNSISFFIKSLFPIEAFSDYGEYLFDNNYGCVH